MTRLSVAGAIIVLVALSLPAFAVGNGMDEALALYSENGKLTFDVQRGKTLWMMKYSAQDGRSRQCSI